MLRPSKSQLQKKSAVLLASSVVDTLTDGGEYIVNLALPHLRPLVPLWVAAAMRGVEACPRQLEQSWSFVFEHSFEVTLAVAMASHAAGTPFR